MKYHIESANLFYDNKIEQNSLDFDLTENHEDVVFDFELNNCYILPGFTDVHTHLREPGFSYKETIRSGSLAAAKSGYTNIFAMPNLLPVPDCTENLEKELEIIKRDAYINVSPYGSITVGQKGQRVADIEALAPFVCGYSDDGFGVRDSAIMKEAMQRAYAVNRPICAHLEDYTQIKDSSAAEYKELERDLKLCQDTGVKLHACHLSTKESVELIRQAKKSKINVSCETAPHYLMFSEKDVKDSGSYKMNPPIRSEADRDALIEGIIDGTIDMIATDHAPHSKEEKGRGFKGSLNGIVGLETAFPIMYTYFVKTKIITFARLMELMSLNAAKRFELKNSGFGIFDLASPYKIDAEKFVSQGKSSPFHGLTVYGKCLALINDGKIVHNTKK